MIKNQFFRYTPIVFGNLYWCWWNTWSDGFRQRQSLKTLYGYLVGLVCFANDEVCGQTGNYLREWRFPDPSIGLASADINPLVFHSV